VFDLIRPRAVLGNRRVGADAFVLTLERRQEVLKAGCHIDVGLPGCETRPYSLFSGESDSSLEILVRRVERGTVSRQLSDLQCGDRVKVDAPLGRFTLDALRPGERVLFLATGTGIAPFRAFIRSRPDLDYTLVHGVRDAKDDFGAEFAPKARRVLCVSGSDVPEGDFAGRVTRWLDQVEGAAYDRAYLCGNARMIFEVFPKLVEYGMDEGFIHTETYF
jgi:ferredoxin--NADP+ reductase/benzoate/toluate 1,2-dioxygenase reductase subunit